MLGDLIPQPLSIFRGKIAFPKFAMGYAVAQLKYVTVVLFRSQFKESESRLDMLNYYTILSP